MNFLAEVKLLNYFCIAFHHTGLRTAHPSKERPVDFYTFVPVNDQLILKVVQAFPLPDGKLWRFAIAGMIDVFAKAVVVMTCSNRRGRTTGRPYSSLMGATTVIVWMTTRACRPTLPAVAAVQDTLICLTPTSHSISGFSTIVRVSLVDWDVTWASCQTTDMFPTAWWPVGVRNLSALSRRSTSRCVSA